MGYSEQVLMPFLIAIFFTLSVVIPKDKKDILKYAKYLCLFIAILLTALILINQLGEILWYLSK